MVAIEARMMQECLRGQQSQITTLKDQLAFVAGERDQWRLQAEKAQGDATRLSKQLAQLQKDFMAMHDNRNYWMDAAEGRRVQPQEPLIPDQLREIIVLLSTLVEQGRQYPHDGKPAHGSSPSYDKEGMNAWVGERWRQLTIVGKHGHYETLFRVVHEAIARVQAPADERVTRLAQQVVQHWREFGPEHGLDEVIEQLATALYPAQPESKR